MKIDTGDTAWILAASALVLFMTPGLALFYGGMVRAKNILAMLMQNFFAMGIVAVLWVLVGYSLAFGNAGEGGWIGNFDYVGLKGMGSEVSGTIPALLFVAFQLTFAVITPALITGAIADRLAAADSQVHVLHRTAKGGLGAAYLHGFAVALDMGYDVIGEMDADGSHQPEQLHQLLTALEHADLVIGSRYVPGGSVVNWPR